MSRGGKRKGSGAKQKEFKKIKVGQFCEKIHRAKLKENYQLKLNKKTENTEKLEEQVRTIPVKDRKAWLQADEDGYLDHLENFYEALRKDQGLLDKSNKLIDLFDAKEITKEKLDQELEYLEPTKLISIKSKKPSRKEILRLAAEKFNLSEHTVDKYWKYYRKLEKTI